MTMDCLTDQRRFAYCKNADVVLELERYGPVTDVIAGGDGRYITSFLRWLAGRPALLLSYGSRDARFQAGDVAAFVYSRSAGSRNPVSTVFVEAGLLRKTFDSLRSFRPNGVLCAASGAPLWACWLYVRLTGAVLVCARHSSIQSGSRRAFSGWRRLLTKWVVKRAGWVLCHGPYLEHELIALGVRPERLIVFNNSYGYLKNRDRDEGADHVTGRVREQRFILFAGSIRRDKGVFDLLHAAESLLQTDSNLRLVFAGSGRDDLEFARVVAQSVVSGQVDLLGYVEHANLTSLISRAALVATPSHSQSTESVCKVVIEALVLGTPVVAPDFGPFPYFVEDRDNGLLFEPDSMESLRHGLAEVLGDRGLEARLRRGAEESGRSWLHSSCSFERALIRSFGA